MNRTRPLHRASPNAYVETATTPCLQAGNRGRPGRREIPENAPPGLYRHLYRICRILPRAQELLDGHPGTRRPRIRHQ